MPLIPEVPEVVPDAEVVDVLTDATLCVSGGPELVAHLTGVHLATALTTAGFAVVRQAGPGAAGAR